MVDVECGTVFCPVCENQHWPRLTLRENNMLLCDFIRYTVHWRTGRGEGRCKGSNNLLGLGMCVTSPLLSILNI